MPKFTDKKGREWEVEVTNDMIPELRSAGLDLSQFTREDQAKDLAASLLRTLIDPERLGQVLSIFCDEQIQALNLTERDFARGMNADALCAATDAVLFASFDHVFRRPELRKLIREELPRLWSNAESQAFAGRSTVPAPYAG